MILCVDTKALKTSATVQKDLDLEDLLKNHTKYYDTEEEALNDRYMPLDFSVSVRSIYSNLVMQTNKKEGKRYYINLSQIQPFIHKGYDLIMYLASIGLMNNIDYDTGFDELMTRHSQFSVIGLYYPVGGIINPIIYSHIIMSDEGMKELNKYLNPNVEIVPISVMNENREGNLPALLDTLIEVKGGKENE